MDGGGDSGFGISIEYGHIGVLGLNVFYDHTDSESGQAIIELTNDIGQIGLESLRR